jgi:hypothetical protein
MTSLSDQTLYEQTTDCLYFAQANSLSRLLQLSALICLNCSRRIYLSLTGKLVTEWEIASGEKLAHQ